MATLAVAGGLPIADITWPSWPQSNHRIEAAAVEVLRSGHWWAHSHGEAVEYAERIDEPPSQIGRFQRAFARLHDSRYGIAAVNGTQTMEILLTALGIGLGDEVIIPAYTFVATGTAVLRSGATPVFVDVDAGTLNLDPSRLDAAITARTRAIMPVHFAGQPAAMREITEIAQRHGLALIEDAAQAHLASYAGRACGSLGIAASFSFQESKNLTAGEGGIITTNDRQLATVIESLVWGGRRVDGEWYAHYRLGSNYRMTELQAAILSSQLDELDTQLRRRQANAARLDQRLGELEGVRPGTTAPDTTDHAYHLYIFRYHADDYAGAGKDTFVAALNAEGIPASGGYGWPLYRNPVFALSPAQIEEAAKRCPAAERACRDEVIWLPQWLLLADGRNVDFVAAAIEKIRRHAHELPSARGL